MMKNKRVLRTIVISLVLAIITSITGCVECNKEDISQQNSSLISAGEKAQGELEQLKRKRDEVAKSIKEAEKAKLDNSQVPIENKEQHMKSFEELEKRMLEESKKLDEKIKALQKDNK